MKSTRKVAIHLLLFMLLTSTLASCGGGSGNHFSGHVLDGVSIDSSNYISVFSRGVSELADLDTYIIRAVNGIDLNNLTLVSSTANGFTLACLNNNGRVTVTSVNASTVNILFDNCLLNNLVTGSTAFYHNRMNSSYSNQSGAGNYPFVNFDWELVQDVTFSNLTIVEDGVSLELNGDAEITESNNVANLQYQARLQSNNLLAEIADDANTRVIEYSEVLYDALIDTGVNVTSIDYDFIANISPDTGDISMTTYDRFVFDADDVLQEVNALVNTGNSVMTIKGQGNDTVVVSIDTNNDGMDDEEIVTSWPVLNAL